MRASLLLGVALVGAGGIVVALAVLPRRAPLAPSTVSVPGAEHGRPSEEPSGAAVPGRSRFAEEAEVQPPTEADEREQKRVTAEARTRDEVEREVRGEAARDEAPAEPVVSPDVVEGAGAELGPVATAARQAANDAVDAARGDMRKACWGGAELPAAAKIGFSLSYGADGKVLASSVSQQRDTYVEGLEQCLAPFAHAIEVPAPGESLSVDVEFELP